MKRLIIAVASMALLAGPVARAGEGKENHPGKRPGGPRVEMPLIPPRLMEDLALTDEQKSKVETLQAEFAKQRDKLRAEQQNNPEIVKQRDEMKAARQANDKEKLRQLHEQLMEREHPLLDLRKQYMDKVRALLTDEQKKKLDEARDRIREHRGPGPHEGGPPPPPKE